MAHKFAIDFGTTNSVIARWNSEEKNAEADKVMAEREGTGIMLEYNENAENQGKAMTKPLIVK